MTPIPVGLSTASVWPRSAATGFTTAAELGYDGVEVMVWADPLSQDVAALRRQVDRTGVPVLAVHAPCLLITQRVWSPDPETRLRRSVEAAQELGARTVVVHPPFRWQRRYADAFPDLVASLEDATGIAVAVENMFPVRRGRAVVSAFRPSTDPTVVGHRHYTLDLSHTAAAGVDAVGLAERMGAGLTHLHLADGTGVAKDEHLVPGRGAQPCARVLQTLAATGFGGQVVLEVNTRRARTAAERLRDLAEALRFARVHLAHKRRMTP
ncbi:sugar phosphate isomerase/epimerase [Actinokineospora sp. UTMC 2448]|uniref:sugar phosphate isomerase/epimerase family protein n=1 Tax=Actinokineospora sp. UTMC 2448 TaxID=2268449 RepID=UPI002164289A|nr:sugar phosphate isomerase/epimerase [Actinokineospora sp. UTMC 2448]UVS82318.1 fructoselysine 3-epimerase [Actinokineospora sp. UTMC 2448]